MPTDRKPRECKSKIVPIGLSKFHWKVFRRVKGAIKYIINKTRHFRFTAWILKAEDHVNLNFLEIQHEIKWTLLVSKNELPKSLVGELDYQNIPTFKGRWISCIFNVKIYNKIELK